LLKMSMIHNDPRIVRGMETHLKIRQACLNAGEKPLGWKVGFGAPAAMARLNINAPLIGFLTDKTLLPSDATVSISGWTKALAEPEIAVYLGRDLDAGSDRETVRAAIAAIGPAIELADAHFPPDDVEAILAGNIYHRHVILGRRDASRAGCVLDKLVGRVSHNGEMTETTDLQALTGDLIEIAQQVAGLLAACGERLRMGEIIIAGSIVPPILIAGKEKICYTLDPVDTIAVNLDA
jgi:2-keto-4-pentenoate hydratase